MSLGQSWMSWRHRNSRPCKPIRRDRRLPALERLEDRLAPASAELSFARDSVYQKSAVSADGRFALVSPTQVNSLDGVFDKDPFPGAYIYDRQADTFAPILTAAPEFDVPNVTAFDSAPAAISRDGGIVVLRMRVKQASRSPVDSTFVLERATGELTALFVNNGVIQETGFGQVALSADGRFIVFDSDQNQLFLFDRTTKQRTLVSRSILGEPGNQDSFHPQISDDGKVVAFFSNATDLTGEADGNSGTDLFLFFRETGQVRLVTKSRNGEKTANARMIPFGGMDGQIAALSGDGKTVALASKATDLVANVDTNNVDDVFLYDVATAEHRLVTRTFGTSAAARSQFAVGARGVSVSDDGKVVTFVTLAEDMHAPAETVNGVTTHFTSFNPYVYLRDTDSIRLIARSRFDPRQGLFGGNTHVTTLSGDGRFAFFDVAAPDMVGLPDNSPDPNQPRLVRYDVANDSFKVVTTKSYFPSFSQDQVAVSADGAFAYFVQLVRPVTSSDKGVFLRDMGASAEVQVAPPAPRPAKPDLLIKRRDRDAFVGQGLFQDETQIVGDVSTRREAITYDIRVRNAGTEAGTFQVGALADLHDDDNFAYVYRRGGVEVTDAVRAVSLSVALDGGQVADLELIVTPKANATFGTTTTLPFVALVGPDVHDVVFTDTRFGLVVNTTKDLDDSDLFDDGVFDVDPTAVGNQLSLRAAIRFANQKAGKDEIHFNIPGGGVPRIDVGTVGGLNRLPGLADPVVIDALTQPGGGLVEIRGKLADANETGFLVATDDSVIKGFVITRFGGHGIHVAFGDNNDLLRNVIGTDALGTATDLGNRGGGIFLEGGSANRVFLNVLAGNDGRGVEIDGGSGNTVIDNVIGTDKLGRVANRNFLGGVLVNNAAGTVIEDNLISGNGTVVGAVGVGVQVSGAASANTTIRRNTIGLSRDKTTALPNGNSGVLFDGVGAGNVVGGDAAADGNTIAGNNKFGFVVQNATSRVSLFHNKIGTKVDVPFALLGNKAGGVLVENASNQQVGGVNKGNTIFGNGTQVGDERQGDGVTITGAACTNNVVVGNLINGNQGSGVVVTDRANRTTVGGRLAGEGNEITNQLGSGVVFSGEASNNDLFGNLIGTNALGTNQGNRDHGVMIENASSNRVGGATPTAGREAGNVIAFNGITGVRVQVKGGTSSGNRIQGNLIGVDHTRPTEEAPNGGRRAEVEDNSGLPIVGGISLSNAEDTLVGGGSNLLFDLNGIRPTFARTPEGNVISGNIGEGVLTKGTKFTTVQGNVIGLDPEARAEVKNTRNGVFVSSSAQDTVVGVEVTNGVVTGAGNVISGNGEAGVKVFGDFSVLRTRIQGNLLGGSIFSESLSTRQTLANRVGILVQGQAVQDARIGDPAIGAGNRVQDNREFGIFIQDVTSQAAGQFAVTIQANGVGLVSQPEDDGSLQPTGVGIDAPSRGVLIGPSPEEFAAGGQGRRRNLFKRNNTAVAVLPTDENRVLQDIRDVAIVGNILFKNGNGVLLAGLNTRQVRVFGNDIDSQFLEGVRIRDAAFNLIDGNRFTSNPRDVAVEVLPPGNNVAGRANAGRFNAILNNTFAEIEAAAIDLVGGTEGPFGDTENDGRDDSDFGPNDLQNFAPIPFAEALGNKGLLDVAVQAGEAGTYHVEVYKVTTGGSGRLTSAQPIGAFTLTMGANETRLFPFVTDKVAVGDRVAATMSRVREVLGVTTFETSELSFAKEIVAAENPDGDASSSAVESANPDNPTNAAGVPAADAADVTSVFVTAAFTFEPLGHAVLFATPGARVERLTVNRREFTVDARIFQANDVDFKVTGVTPGGSHKFKLLLPVAGEGVIGVKEKSGTLVFIDPSKFKESRDPVTGKRFVEITITDGPDGLDQDGVVNGEIVDPLTVVSVPANDLTVSKTKLTADPVINAPFSYKVEVKNTGTTAAPVVLTETLSSAAGLLTFVPSQGTVTRNGNVLTVNFGSVVPGATVSLTVTLKQANVGTVTTQSAAKFGDVFRAELNAADNVANLTLTVNRPPVVARLIGRKLFVTGTAFADKVRLTMQGTRVTVTPLPGTRLNGDTKAVAFVNVAAIDVRTLSGNDTIELVGAGFRGPILLAGGLGNDIYKLGARGAKVTILDPDGRDRVGFSLSSLPVTLDLRQSLPQVIDSTGTTLTMHGKIEEATGSKYNDTLQGEQGTHQLNDGGGQDLLVLHPLPTTTPVLTTTGRRRFYLPLPPSLAELLDRLPPLP